MAPRSPDAEAAGAVYKARVFSSGNPPPPEVAERVFTLEEPAPRLRRLPVVMDTVTRQSPLWGHHMPPFGDAAYRSTGLDIWRARRAITAGSDGFILLNDGTFDAPHAYFAQFEAGSPITRPKDGTLTLTRPVTRRTEGAAFLAFNGGYRNYAHFLTDHLIALWAYAERFRHVAMPLLLPHRLAAFGRDAVEALGLSAQAVWLDDEPVEVEELYFCSHMYLPEPPASFAMAARWLRERLIVKSAGGARLFISRRDAHARPCINALEVEALMERFGFEIVVPGTMSLRQQAEAFARADRVVGFHGAGMMNVMFCPPGCSVLELFPEHVLQSHFWTVADAMDLHYGYVCGTSYERDDADVVPHGHWDSACSFDLRKIEAAMRRMETL